VYFGKRSRAFQVRQPPLGGHLWLPEAVREVGLGRTHLSGLCLQSGEVIYFTLEIVVLAQVRFGGVSPHVHSPARAIPPRLLGLEGKRGLAQTLGLGLPSVSTNRSGVDGGRWLSLSAG
jgi:hypothetical protein